MTTFRAELSHIARWVCVIPKWPLRAGPENSIGYLAIYGQIANIQLFARRSRSGDRLYQRGRGCLVRASFVRNTRRPLFSMGYYIRAEGYYIWNLRITPGQILLRPSQLGRGGSQIKAQNSVYRVVAWSQGCPGVYHGCPGCP